MTRPLARFALAMCLFGAVASASKATTQFEQKAPPDADDPLPAGAVSRLGTARYRLAGPVKGLAISPDGKTFASAGREICLWNFASGKKLHRIVGDPYPSVLAFGDNGKTLITVSDPGILRYRDVATGKIVHQCSLVSDANDWEDYAAITRDGRFLAFKDTKANTVCIWDLDARKEVNRIKSANYDFGPLAISLDGKALALGRGDIEIWDLDAGKVMQTLKLMEPSYVRAFGFSPDGKTFVSSGSHRHGTRSWDMKTGKVRTKYGMIPPESRAFAFSDDGKRLATVTYVGEPGQDDFYTALRVWDFAAGRELWHSATLPWSTSLVFTPDGKTLVSAGSEDIIRLWEVAAGKEIKSHGSDAAPRRLTVTHDGRRLAASSYSAPILLWDLKSQKQIAQFTGSSWYRLTAFSPDGKLIAYAHNDRSVRLCDTDTGKEIRKFSPHEKDAGDLDQRDKDVTALVFEPDGQTLLISHADLTLRTRRVTDGKVLRDHTLEPSVKVGNHMHYHLFSRDAPVLLDLETYRSYDASRGRLLSAAERPANGFGRDFAMSPDGRTFVAVDQKDGTLLIYEVATGRKRLAITRQKTKEETYGYWGPLAFSPDGRLVAARSVDGKTIEVWNTANGKRMHTIPNTQEGLTALSFVGDGDILATGGRDTTILLWDVSAVRKKR